MPYAPGVIVEGVKYVHFTDRLDVVSPDPIGVTLGARAIRVVQLPGRVVWVTHASRLQAQLPVFMVK
jgi:hypothetical protein